MSSVVILAFTSKGYASAQLISESIVPFWQHNIETYRVGKLAELVPKVFKQGNIIIFVGAAGIAVRAVAPYLSSKATDPAVIVVDEQCKFVIPILCGHIGGANSFAKKLAFVLNSTAVITTSTDVNGVFAVDCFAAENGFVIANPNMIKHISSHLLHNKAVGLASDFEVESLPYNVTLQDSGEIGICISSDINKKPFDKTLHILPKCFHVGVGAKKNTDPQQLDAFFMATLAENNIPVQCVAAIASISLKMNEAAICKLSEKYQIPYVTYTADELLPYENTFSFSPFVKKTTGVGNVCEASAYKSSIEGELVCTKKSENGMTIAIAKHNRRITFEDTNDWNKGC